VEAELRRRIRASGRITFAQFMETALYLPDAGYYQAQAEIGRRGDFLTSPETHPVFGALLARLACRLWRALDSPRRFAVLEYGAGTGSLCRQFLAAAPHLDGDFAAALAYLIVERSAFLRARQQELLLDFVGRVQWIPPDRPPEPVAECVLANEVVDALPVHRLQVEGGGLREIYVGCIADRYLELRGSLSTPQLEGLRPPEESAMEICLAAADWVRDAALRLGRGYVITIDFGGSAEVIYGSATPRGALKCFWRHGWTDDPYDRPGLQDITAPVDFTNLQRQGEVCGLEVMMDMSQQELLERLGICDVLEAINKRELPVEERERNLRAVRALCDPRGLGSYRVLVQSKSAPAIPFDLPEESQEVGAPMLPSEAVGWPE